MKCQVHEEKDVVATCVSCGRGVCEECKVLHDDIVHCRQCVDRGLIVDRPSLDWEDFFYYMPQPGLPGEGLGARALNITTPYPTEAPDRKPFEVGRYGSITSAVVSLVFCLSVAFLPGPHNLLWVVPVLTLGTMPLLIGLYGFHRNYGSKSAILATWSLALFFMLLLGIVVYLFMEIQYYGIEPEDLDLTFFAAGLLLIGIGFLLTGSAFYSLTRYFAPGILIRRFMTWTSLALMGTSALLVLLNLGTIFGVLNIRHTALAWAILAIPLLMMYPIFRSAPLPERRLDRISGDRGGPTDRDEDDGRPGPEKGD